MKIRLIDRIRAAIQAFKDPIYNKSPSVLYVCDGNDCTSGRCSE